MEPFNKTDQSFLIVTPQTSVQEAIQQMKQGGSSYVLVQEQQKLIGLFTEQDVVSAIAAGATLREAIANWMSQPIVTITESEAEDFSTVLQKFRAHGVHYLPIVNVQGWATGVVTAASLVHRLDSMEWCSGIEAVQQAVNTKSVDSQHEIRQCKRAETDRDMYENRLQLQQFVMMGLSKSPEIYSGDLSAASQKITQAVAHTVTVERVSLWLYNGDRTKLYCFSLYELSQNRYSTGMELSVAEYGQYFQALETNKFIAVNDIYANSQEGEPLISYRFPLNIGATIDVPIRSENKTVGVLWLEHVGSSREWMVEDQNFATYAAYLSSLALEAHDRRQAEAALRESEARNRALVNALPDLLIQMRADGTYLNVVCGDSITLFKPEPMLVGANINDILPLNLAQERMHYVQQALQTGALQVYEYQLEMAGKTYVEEARIVACGSDKVLAIIRDITERKQAEEQLRQMNLRLEESNRELQSFAFIASHDLKEPLRTIRSFSNLLENLYTDVLNEEGRDYLRRIQRAVRRMQTQIDDLLLLSRVTTQAKPFTQVNLSQIIQTVRSGLEAEIQKTGTIIQVEDLPTFEADASQLLQLFQNLISNAIKFRRAAPPLVKIRGHILQETPSNRPCCQILVEDNGIGFEEKYGDRIFKIFERLHSQDDYEGTGIGLAICRKIAERHGGSITAHSVPGQGATFIITLPIHQMPQ